MRLTLCSVALLVACVFAPIFAQPSPTLPAQRLDALRARLPAFKTTLDQLKSQGKDISYPDVTYTILEHFIPFATEDLNRPMPSAWQADARGTTATFAGDASVAHGGAISYRFTNATAQAPNVFGMAFASSPIKLAVGQPYTLSCFIKTDDPGVAWVGGGSKWQFRVAFRPTAGEWHRVSVTFTPEPADVDFAPRIVTESPSKGINIDDVALVAGEKIDDAKPNLVVNGSFEDSWTTKRALDQIADLEQLAAKLEADLKTPQALKPVPRWNGQHRPRIDGPSFLDETGRPHLFIGYGHFQQARKDVDIFPRYGINLMQEGEYGPAQIFPSEDKVDDATLKTIKDLLDRGQKAGVGIDFLISPHYVPAWWLAKNPGVVKRRMGGVFAYSPYTPQGLDLMKRFAEVAIAPFKDHPALFSICLTNEPANFEEPSDASIKLWHEWLTKKHNDIATLNARWHTTFKTFDEILQPNPFDPSKTPRPSPLWNDYVRWNQEFWAGWHAQLAEIVHAAAPNVPVHAKSTTWLYISDNSDIDNQYGLDPTLFSAFSNINGNDTLNHYRYGQTDFAQWWQRESKAIELLRSIKDIPTFDSENHPITDRETRPVPPEHIRTALWQAAVRGQSATTMWVWERTFDPGSDFAGSILHRPACAAAVGEVCLDLNRVSPQIRALQQAKPDVLILHSTSAIAWGEKNYDRTLDNLFTALSFTGLRVGFVTERQLESGTVPAAKLLCIPNAVHFSKAARESLTRFTGKFVLVGDGCLSRDEYDNPTPPPTGPTVASLPHPADANWRQLWTDLPAQLADLKPLVQLRDDKGQPIWGVEWRCARTEAGVVVNLCNYRNDAVTVALSPAPSKDLLLDQPCPPTLQLKPLETRLLLVP